MIPTKATVGGHYKRQSSAEIFLPLVQEMQANVSRILGVVHISLDMLEAPGAMVRPPKKRQIKLRYAVYNIAGYLAILALGQDSMRQRTIKQHQSHNKNLIPSPARLDDSTHPLP